MANWTIDAMKGSKECVLASIAIGERGNTRAIIRGELFDTSREKLADSFAPGGPFVGGAGDFLFSYTLITFLTNCARSLASIRMRTGETRVHLRFGRVWTLISCRTNMAKLCGSE